jgi:hypothetical protein
MNCLELAATLEGTLLRERDALWFQEARRHAEQCPSCARILELHQVEELLAGLSAVEPGRDILQAVMSRITQREPASVVPAPGLRRELLKYAMVLMGAWMMAAASIAPAAGGSWLSSLWPPIGVVRAPGILAYLNQHPPWAVLLAGIAALLIILGLAVPERREWISGDHSV